MSNAIPAKYPATGYLGQNTFLMTEITFLWNLLHIIYWKSESECYSMHEKSYLTINLFKSHFLITLPVPWGTLQ